MGRRAEKYDVVAILEENDIAAFGERVLVASERRLDRHHADRRRIGTIGVAHRHRKTVAGFSRRVADAVEAADAAPDRLAEVGPISVVFADETAGLVPIACGERIAVCIHQIGADRAGKKADGEYG